jgi:hypothetical protein
MKKQLAKVLTVLAFAMAALSAKATVVYAGSWNINGSGAQWWYDNPLAYSATGAAQLLFGSGTYYISTVDNQVADINHMAYYNIIGVGNTIFNENYFRGTEGTTHYNDVWVGDANTDTVSAYVNDEFTYPYDWNNTVNYAFRVEGVPDTVSTFGLLGAGLIACSFLRRKMRAA